MAVAGAPSKGYSYAESLRVLPHSVSLKSLKQVQLLPSVLPMRKWRQRELSNLPGHITSKW